LNRSEFGDVNYLRFVFGLLE